MKTLFITLLLTLGACNSLRAEFKPGDCIAQDFSNEFKKEIYYNKILKVGEEYYLVNTRSYDSTRYWKGTDRKS